MAFFNPDDYIDVQERIKRFWQEHPNGAIVTKLMSPPDEFEACRYEASAYKDVADLRPSAVGYAQEFRITEGRGVNTTSHEENCETSAIGRALANMGYATSLKDRPSKQEMGKVQRTNEALQAGAVEYDNRGGQPQRHEPQHNTGNGGGGGGGSTQPATPRQIKFIQAIAREHGMSDDALNSEVEQLYGRPVEQLDRRDASAFIERLQSRRNVTELGG